MSEYAVIIAIVLGIAFTAALTFTGHGNGIHDNRPCATQGTC